MQVNCVICTISSFIFIKFKYSICHCQVVRKFYDIRVEGKDVYLGNVAFLRCFIPEYVREYVKVTSWYRDDEILLPELADICTYLTMCT